MLVVLTVDKAKTQGHVGFGVFLLNLIFELLLQAHSSIADQNIINLLEVKINMVVVMSILPLVLLSLLLFALMRVICVALWYVIVSVWTQCHFLWLSL